jgi:hypothetical protein
MASLDVVVSYALISIFIIISLGDGGRKDARTPEKLLKALSMNPLFIFFDIWEQMTALDHLPPGG